jgi:hypothetical protein
MGGSLSSEFSVYFVTGDMTALRLKSIKYCLCRSEYSIVSVVITQAGGLLKFSHQEARNFPGELRMSDFGLLLKTHCWVAAKFMVSVVAWA